MTRAEREFQVAYSMHLEDMARTLLSRLDRVSSFLQIVLGVAVITAEAPKLTGILVTVVAAYQLVWQPGVKAGEAKAAFEAWSALFRERSVLDDTTLESRVKDASRGDSAVPGSIKVAAHRAAAVQLNRSLEGCPELSKWERFITHCAGGTVY